MGEKKDTNTNPDVWRSLQDIDRTIPDAGDHPGNVFLEGEQVTIKIPSPLPEKVVSWRILDDRGNELKRAEYQPEKTTGLGVGTLGIGWYRVEFLGSEDRCLSWTTAAVLAKLKEPVPQDSPICVDAANAWFAKDDPAGQERLTRLAALAGVNWIRDRMRWRDVQPEPDRFEPHTTYDSSADIQAKFGLKVLQVFHDTPPWAMDETSRRGRFPRDLRHLYAFCKAMSQHYKNRVQAWEPWNEANAGNFGGHTADEMCSMQKAAWLGFKAGDPNVTVGWNAYAGVPSRVHTQCVLNNETWSYYHTYNIHTYDWPDSYYNLREPAREAACGRPIWLTEADRGIACLPEKPWLDLSQENERLKAEFMAQSYATSLFAGCQRHFHFILGQYSEGTIQFGLLRLDMTPRPAYVALAALGRLLAGARCLGKWTLEDQPLASLYAFRAKPGGVEQDVLVAWAERKGDWPVRGQTSIDWPLPNDLPIENLYDYLGRPIGQTKPEKLTSAPIFVLLPPGGLNQYPLQAPPVSDYRPGNPSPVVLQLQTPLANIKKLETRHWIEEYENFIEPDKETELTLWAYNFDDKEIKGTISVEHLPEGWTLSPQKWEVTLEPSERKKLTTRLHKPKGETDKNSDTWIKLRGNFDNAEPTVLAFRLIACPEEGYDY